MRPTALLLLASLLVTGLRAGPLEEAREMLAVDRAPAAVELLQGALSRTPGDLELRELLGEARSRTGDYQGSFRAYREVLAQRPGDPRVLAHLRRLRKPLVRDLRQTLRARAGDRRALHALAFLLAMEGKVAKGKAQLLRLTRMAPDFAPGWNDLGWVYLASGKLEEAFRLVSRAFELDPGSAAVRRHLSILRERRQQAEEGKGQELGDPLYGILGRNRTTPEKPASSPLIPPAATLDPVAPAPETTGPRFDFGKVDLEDDALVASLLNRIEEETMGSVEPTPVATVEGPAPVEDTRDQSVPTPLEVLQRIQQNYDQGVEAMREGRFEEAERALRLVISLKRDYKDSVTRLGRVEDALENLDRLEEGRIRLEGGDGRRAANLLGAVPRKLVALARPELDLDSMLGRAYFLSGDWSRAESSLRKALGREPEDAELRYSLFLSLVRLEKVPEALEELAILEKVQPGYAGSRQGHGQLVLRLYIRRYVWILALLALLWGGAVVGYLVFFGRRKVRGDFYGTQVDQVQEAIRLEEFTRAREALETLEEMGLEGERATRALSLRVSVLIGLGRLPEAREALGRLESEGGETPASRVQWGRIYLAEGVVDDRSRPYLRDLLQAEPSNRALLELLHETACKQQDFSDEAHEVLTRLLGLDPDDPELILRETEFLAERGDLSPSAVLHFRRTLQIDEKNRAASRGVARALLDAGQALDALEVLRKALKFHRDAPEFLRMAGEAYTKLELLEEGVQLFQRLVDRGGGGVAEEELGKLTELLRRVRAEENRSLEEEKKLGTTYDEGVQLFSKGRYAEAIPQLEAALEAQAYRRHAGALLVKAHLALGEVERAWDTFSRLEVEECPSDEFMIGLCYDMARALQERSEFVGARDLFRRVCRADVDYKDAFERFEELEERLLLSS